ncbi:MAG: hypothetical protein HY390_06310 [Deltaproteobacteria bacterium]|nr:hypothetical protein [Deltaproteobacteria bacterium]
MKHLWLFFGITLATLCGCSQKAFPPKFTQTIPQPLASQESILDFNIPAPCQTLKFTGTLTDDEFKKLFACLNKNGTLNPIMPFLFDNAEDSPVFVDLYNKTFGEDPALRQEVLNTLDIFIQTGALQDILPVFSLFLSEFVNSKNFDTVLEPILKTILSNDISTFHSIQTMVASPLWPTFSRFLMESWLSGSLPMYFEALGYFFSNPDGMEPSTAQLFIETLEHLIKLKRPGTSPITLEDLYVLSYLKTPRNFLETLQHSFQPNDLSELLAELSDLLNHQTASYLSPERLGLLSDPTSSLGVDQRNASRKILKYHPKNDLTALVKLISSFHRGFSTNESLTLLDSMDIFVMGSKTAFEALPELGPDTPAAHIITNYSLWLSCARIEMKDPVFHRASLEDKVKLYSAGDILHPDESDLRTYTFAKHVKSYVTQQKAQFNRELNEFLETEEKPQIAKKEIQMQFGPILPLLAQSYEDSLRELAKHHFETINRPLLPTLSTDEQTLVTKIAEHLASEEQTSEPLSLFTLFKALEEVDSLALFFQKSLALLDNDYLFTTFENALYKITTDFLTYNQPVDHFLRSIENVDAESTFLNYALTSTLYGMNNKIPEKDQIVLISALENYQSLERLLTQRNLLKKVKKFILPFVKVIPAGQERRVLSLVSWLHSGKFLYDDTSFCLRSDHPLTETSDPSTQMGECFEPIDQISTLLSRMETSHFLQPSLDLVYAWGDTAETLNHVMTFLLQSESKQKLMKTLSRLSSLPPHLKTNLGKGIHTSVSEKDYESIAPLLLTLSEGDRMAISSQFPTLIAAPQERLITPILLDTKNLILTNKKPCIELLAHLPPVLTHEHLDDISRFLKKYTTHFPEKRILTQVLQSGQIEALLRITHHMIEQKKFQNMMKFVSRLIDQKQAQRSELEITLTLLIKLLKLQGGKK